MSWCFRVTFLFSFIGAFTDFLDTASNSILLLSFYSQHLSLSLSLSGNGRWTVVRILSEGETKRANVEKNVD